MGVRFEHVEKRYGDVLAVADVTIDVPTGSTTVLLGSSGSGKTTLLRMVNRMVDPTAGRVLIDDRDVAQQDAVALRRRIGYVMQAGGLMPHWRVIDNVATGLRLNGVSKKAARVSAADMLEVVGLEPALADRYPAELSGGQRQRVGVARALATDPNILLMDEPFGAVDPIQRRILQDEMLRIQNDLHKTIILVTHDVDEALRLGDQIVVLKPGGVVAQIASPQELVAHPADAFVIDFLGPRGALRVSDGVVLDGDGRAVGRLHNELAEQ